MRNTKALNDKTYLSLTFERINELIENERLYCSNAKVNRDTLSERLKINHTYVSLSIRWATGMSFSEYIEELRWREMYRYINKKKINDWQEFSKSLGFNSYTTFYRSFMRRFGHAPSSIRQ